MGVGFGRGGCECGGLGEGFSLLFFSLSVMVGQWDGVRMMRWTVGGGWYLLGN